MCKLEDLLLVASRESNDLLWPQLDSINWDALALEGIDAERYGQILLFKWRILSQPGRIGSGKNKKIFILPTGLEDHLEDMF